MKLISATGVCNVIWHNVGYNILIWISVNMILCIILLPSTSYRSGDTTEHEYHDFTYCINLDNEKTTTT